MNTETSLQIALRSCQYFHFDQLSVSCSIQTSACSKFSYKDQSLFTQDSAH